MNFVTAWLERKKAALCILAGICSVSLFVIINSGEKIKENTGGSYVVKIKHYGLDAAEIERSVTIPLEDSLSAITGVVTVQSSSENSLSRIFIRFKNSGKGQYEAVRDAAQRVYETLPPSAQRPEITSSNNSRVPIWSAAVFSANGNDDDNFLTSQILEKIVKPRLESLEGAGEVLVSGAGLKEIIIVLDQEKLDILGLQPSAAAAALGMNDSIFSGGTIEHGNREIVITVDGRYAAVSGGSPSSLARALIPLGNGKYTELCDIALITEQERQPDILSRLNGKKTAGIAIMGRSDADLRRLSTGIKKELSSLASDQSLPFEFTILSDLGAEEAAAFRSVLNAALLGAIMVAGISFLLKGNNTSNLSGVFCALSIPFIFLVSIAVLSIGGFSTDRIMLAGIAAGLGTAIDAVILCSEKLPKCKSYGTASTALADLSRPLIAGTATTVAALLPLSSVKDGEVSIIASAISVVCLSALLVSLSLLPPLLLWGLNSKKENSGDALNLHRKGTLLLSSLAYAKRRLTHSMCRFLAADVRLCICHPRLIPLAGLALTAAAVFALFARGVDASSHGSADSVYAQVEFEGGLLAEETDRLLAEYGAILAGNAGIKNVETGARTGSGSLLISFDPKQIRADAVRDLAKRIPIPGGFVFFLENSNRSRYWEIKIYGDEDQKCRELAEELLYYTNENPLIQDRVLNFKRGSKKLILYPDRELFAESKAGFANAASRVRLGVLGPVAYKRTDSTGEMDVRIRTAGGSEFHDYLSSKYLKHQSKEGTLGILVSSSDENSKTAIKIDSLMQTKDDYENASIRRNDRRRTASITVSTKPMDPRRAKRQLEGVFNKLVLPPGYSVEFDPDAIRQAQSLSATVLSLFLAVLFCYMIIAAINESFAIPLLVLSAIPPSLAVPALILALAGSAYNSAVACAFIAVSGMTVNAAVLTVDGLYNRKIISVSRRKSPLRIYQALRRKIPAILATSITTDAGAIPFL